MQTLLDDWLFGDGGRETQADFQKIATLRHGSVQAAAKHAAPTFANSAPCCSKFSSEKQALALPNVGSSGRPLSPGLLLRGLRSSCATKKGNVCSTYNGGRKNWQECKSDVKVLLHTWNKKSAFSSSATQTCARSDVRVLLQRKKFARNIGGGRNAEGSGTRGRQIAKVCRTCVGIFRRTFGGKARMLRAPRVFCASACRSIATRDKKVAR